MPVETLHNFQHQTQLNPQTQSCTNKYDCYFTADVSCYLQSSIFIT
jgi:hypothetical protein